MDSAAGDGPFLDLLTPMEADDLRRSGQRREFKRGEVVFHADDDSTHVLVLGAGRMKVSIGSPEGKEVVLAFSGPGDLLGEISAITGRPRSATVTALEAGSGTILRGPEFARFLERHPRLAVVLLRTVAIRLLDADRQRLEFAAYDTVGRVARRLVELSSRFGEPDGQAVAITLPLSQEELAGWTGSSREAVAKALQTLRELDLIETRRRRIVVRDVDRLRSMAV
jgi:CRP/FNR family transcriptional regulator, cyclic AMP receptor protein